MERNIVVFVMLTLLLGGSVGASVAAPSEIVVRVFEDRNGNGSLDADALFTPARYRPSDGNSGITRHGNIAARAAGSHGYPDRASGHGNPYSRPGRAPRANRYGDHRLAYAHAAATPGARRATTPG